MPSERTFHERGFRFSCTRCANCCKSESGHLFLSALDLRRLARALELTDGEFFLEYCEVVDLGVAQRVSLIAAEDHTCVLLKDGQCAVYEARPLQCRTYPFWGIHLADPESWQRASKSCPGIGQGRLWSRKQIDECVDSRERDPLLDVLSDPDG